MSIFNRVILILLGLTVAYCIYGISHFKWMYHAVEHPKADFQIMGDENADVTFVEFLNYGCVYCKQLDPIITEMLEVRPDIRYIARPVMFTETDEDNVTKLIMAAGLQGKFWEMHKAVLNYPEVAIPNDFIKETANLYGLDYAQMVEDANSKRVKKFLDNNLTALDHAAINSVPSFVVNGKIYIVDDNGIPNLKQLLSIISDAENK